MNLKYVLSEGNLLSKTADCMVPFMCNVYKWQTYKDRNK